MAAHPCVGERAKLEVVRTWTRELQYHPYVHAIVTAGGLSDSGWKSMSRKYLFPVEVMGELLRGKPFEPRTERSLLLKSVEFLRRFTQHVLPKGLQKIRHYGLYAGAASDALAQARALLHGANCDETRVNIERLRTWQSLLKELTGKDVNVCPKCGGQVGHQPLAAQARAPPEACRAA